MENVKNPYITATTTIPNSTCDIYNRLLINGLLGWFKLTEIKITFGISPLLEKSSVTTIEKL